MSTGNKGQNHDFLVLRGIMQISIIIMIFPTQYYLCFNNVLKAGELMNSLVLCNVMQIKHTIMISPAK